MKLISKRFGLYDFHQQYVLLLDMSRDIFYSEHHVSNQVPPQKKPGLTFALNPEAN